MHFSQLFYNLVDRESVGATISYKNHVSWVSLVGSLILGYFQAGSYLYFLDALFRCDFRRISIRGSVRRSVRLLVRPYIGP